MTIKEAEELLERTAQNLGEHFDAVQIMASRPADKGTQVFMRGYGNWFARQGMAHEFINRDRAHEIGYEVNRQRPDS